MPECIICKTRNLQIVIPKNEDLRNISIGLHFCILTDVRVVNKLRHTGCPTKNDI